jgi:NAD+ kinase
MSSVLLVAHHDRLEAAALAKVAAEWLQHRGHDVWMLEADAEALSMAWLQAGHPGAAADLVISLGGDGTMLRAVKAAIESDAAVMGVNVGLLGYLTEVEPHALEPALERWAAGPVAGEWTVEERMMLQVEVRHGGHDTTTRFVALNEGVIEKQEAGHTVRMAVSIDGAPFTSYAADGLIVATPTGSTAYSLSARGPVVSPKHRAVLVTPVSPHMLFDRSLVLDPDEVVDVEIIGHRPAILSVDGQVAARLAEGDAVTARAADETARFVRFGGRRFHQVLKAKFGLSDR